MVVAVNHGYCTSQGPHCGRTETKWMFGGASHLYIGYQPSRRKPEIHSRRLVGLTYAATNNPNISTVYPNVSHSLLMHSPGMTQDTPSVHTPNSRPMTSVQFTILHQDFMEFYNCLLSFHKRVSFTCLSIRRPSKQPESNESKN